MYVSVDRIEVSARYTTFSNYLNNNRPCESRGKTKGANVKDYSIYDHLKSHDIIEILRPLLDSKAYKLRLVDGKFEMSSGSISKDTPWIHVKHTYGFDCGLWHQIIFNVVSKVLPDGQKFVPRNCQNCWKVVVKPRTLQQLFNLLEIEKKLDRPSKCGIEVRDTVHGLYGGYFYNHGKEAGLECYEAVYNAMADNEVMKPLLTELDEDNRTTRLILKRACTEFEHACGRSDEWEVTDGQNAIEDLIERYVVPDTMTLSQPEHLIWNIQRRWIEFAWKYGDPTYALYTNGKPLYPPYVTYHPRRDTK